MGLEQKKFLFLIPSLGTGGAERQMVELIRLLNEKKIKPFVLTYYSEKNDYDAKLNVQRIRVNESNFVLKYLKIIIKAYRVKPDTILSYGTIPNVLAILISVLLFKKIAVVSERNTTQNYSFGKKVLFNFYRLSKFVVPNSISQTDFIKEHAPFLNDKVKTITNYTDTAKFKQLIKEKETIIKIGVFARYHPQKNIMRFLDAVNAVNKKHTNIEYHWFGQNFLDEDGNPTKYSEYYFSCKEYKEKLELSNVYFHNFSKNVMESFKQFDAICLPSLYEGFSNVLSEAVCCGKPVLTSAVCDNVLFVNDGKNGYSFDPKGVTSMSLAIDKFVGLSNTQLKDFQDSSRVIAEKLFSKERFLSNYIEVLN